MSDDISKEFATFESIKHVDGNGNEYWFARELMAVLDYAKWEYFQLVIERAKIAARNVGADVDNQFPVVRKMVSVGYGNERAIIDYRLTRYACYLIAQNGNPQKKPIADAMTYFAEQTHRYELQVQDLTDAKRLEARKKLTVTEKKFAGVVMDRGVDRFGLAEIKAVGDQYLFGGNTTQAMKNKYRVRGKKPLADVLPTVSLKAKDLAAEMTTVNTEMKNLRGKNPIGNEHVQNNEQVRDALIKRVVETIERTLTTHFSNKR
jgi:DNA-damage-inducible protein D